MTIPPAIAEEMCARCVAAFDARHPGRLTGLYLVGSVALDDFHPGRSDVDFVAVTRDPISLADVAPIHAELATAFPRPFFDGLYVTEAELAAVLDGTRGVAVIEGVPRDHSGAERNPVTWLTLARHGIALRGPPPSDIWINADLAAARAFSRDNLVRYWQPWIAARRALLSPAGWHGFTADAVTWSVLGVSRLHALIVASRIVSKTGAGLYARDVFPQHRAIIDCALAIRRGEPGRFPGGLSTRRAAMLACLDAVVADALSARA